MKTHLYINPFFPINIHSAVFVFSNISQMKQHHFVIISLPAQSHINPTLQLAKNLSRAGTRCTFVTTVNGFRKLNNLPSIDGLFYASISDGNDDGAAKMDFGDYLKQLKRVGSENLKKLIDELAGDGHPVTCLVYTFLWAWVAEVAREINLPSAFLAIQSATAFAIYHHLFSINNNGVYSSTSEIELSFPIKLPELPLFSRDDIPSFLLQNDPYSYFMIPVMREHIQNLEHDPNPRVLVNTFDKLEEKSLKIPDKIGICSIGPLIPSAFLNGNVEDKSFGCDLFEKSETYCQWLDSKPEGSVVYVAFGSVAMVKEEQKEEVLQSLMESEMPFLWVIRSSTEDDKKKNDEIYGLNGKGMIVPWCSQMEVLFHKSIGCFVSHCGWNSTLESTVAGVPLIGVPQLSDQMTNIKMVEEVWGTGVRARVEEEEGGIVKREELKRCLEVLMGDGEKGNEIRRNVKKYRDLAMEAVKVGGSSHNNLNEFLESL